MSTINNTDEFLVQRGTTSFKTKASDLMSTIEDTDLMLIQRGIGSYKVTCEDVKDQLGGGGGGNTGSISAPVEVLTPVNGAGMSDGPITPLSSAITNVDDGGGSYVAETSDITNVQQVGIDEPYATEVDTSNGTIISGSSPGFMFDGDANTSFKITGRNSKIIFNCQGIPGFDGTKDIGVTPDGSFTSDGNVKLGVALSDGTYNQTEINSSGTRTISAPGKAIRYLDLQGMINTSPYNVGWKSISVDGVELVGNYQIGASTELTLEDNTNLNLFKQGNVVKGSIGSTQSAAFSTTLYTGNASATSDGSEQVITTGIDNTQKSMIWIKNRDTGSDHTLFDSERTPPDYRWLYSNDTKQEQDSAAILKDRTDTGFTVVQATSGSGTGRTNPVGENMVAWNFRAAPQFMDIVTWDGTGVAKIVPHALTSEPGFIITKSTSIEGNWLCYHKDLNSPESSYIPLDRPDEQSAGGSAQWNYTLPTSSGFSVGEQGYNTNNSGTKYVAYLFADTPGLIKCGSYTGAGAFTAVNVGFKPRFMLIKSSTQDADWAIITAEMANLFLRPDTPDPQSSQDFDFTDSPVKGVTLNTADSKFNTPGKTYIYVAIAEDAMAGEFSPTGELLEDASNAKINLINTTGTWETGGQVAKGAIDAALELTFQSTANLDLMVGPVTMTDENGDAKVPVTSAITNVVDTPGGWNAVAAVELNSWQSVTYGAGKFVAVASDGRDDQVMYSTDGTSWTAILAAETTTWRSVVYGGDKFVAVATSGSKRVMYSTDGISWASASAAGATFWSSVAYGNGKFVAVSSTELMYSTNGISWTSVASVPASGWYAVTYGNGKFVAVANSSGNNRVMYSADGISWTLGTGAENITWRSVTYGANKFVAVASDGTNQVMYSTDGISWTSASAAEDNSWYSVTYGDGKFVAVATDGTNRVMYSADAINWTAASASEANSWNSITYGGDKFVAVAGDGTNRVMWSTTGANASTELTLTNSQDLQYLKAGDVVTAPASSTQSAAFSTTLYPGTGAEHTINTGIDNTGKALVWCKNIDADDSPHTLWDTLRGTRSWLQSNDNAKNQGSGGDDFKSFDSAGFTLGDPYGVPGVMLNGSGNNFVAWNFRAAPGFMDVVTFEKLEGVVEIPHSLNAVPAVIILKNYDSNEHWYVYHKDLLTKQYVLYLDESNSQTPNPNLFQEPPTSTEFTLGTIPATGDNYVAYLFADNADNGIKCGSYPGTGGDQTIDCGFEVAWVMIKCASDNGTDWNIYDVRRGLVLNNTSDIKALLANEASDYQQSKISSFQNGFGFIVTEQSPQVNKSGGTYVYVAIAKDAKAGQIGAVGTLLADADVAARKVNVAPTSGAFETNKVLTGEPLVASATDVMYVDGNKVGLSGVVPTWLEGLYMQGATVTDYGPSPTNVTYTSMNAGSTKYTGIDSNLLSRTWTLQYRAVETDPWSTVGVYEDTSVVLNQDGSTPWPGAPDLQPEAYYQVMVKYNASNADPVESVYATFKTAAS